MKKNVLKPILIGLAFGSFVFFTGPLILIVFLLKFIFTPFGMGRMMMGKGIWNNMGRSANIKFAMADKIRNMSEADYTLLKEKMKKRNFCNN